MPSLPGRLSVLAFVACVAIGHVVLARPCTDVGTLALTSEQLIACGFTDSIDTELSQNIDAFCDADPATQGPPYTAADSHCKKLHSQSEAQCGIFVQENRAAALCPAQVPAGYYDYEFVGFHGTQSRNADAYQNNGVRRLRATSGADAELGEGLYVTDDVHTATRFADGAAGAVNTLDKIPPGPKRVTPQVCMVYAKDRTAWRQDVKKFYFPTNAGNGARLVASGRTPAHVRFYEQNRVSFAAANAGIGGDFVRFAAFDRGDPAGTSQFSIPEPLQSQLFVVCYPIGDSRLLLEGTHPVYSYRKKMEDWSIKGQCDA